MKIEVYGNPNDKTENVNLFCALLNSETGHSHQKDLENMESDSNLVVIGRIGVETLANLQKSLMATRHDDNLGFIFLADKPRFVDNQNAIEHLALMTGRTVVYAPDGVEYQMNLDGAAVNCMAIGGNFMEATPDADNLVEIKTYGSSIRFDSNQQEVDKKTARIEAICESLGKAPGSLSPRTLSSMETPDSVAARREEEQTLSPSTSKRSFQFKRR